VDYEINPGQKPPSETRSFGEAMSVESKAVVNWEEVVTANMDGHVLSIAIPYNFLGIVDTDTLRVRSAPQLTASVTGVLKDGTNVSIESRSTFQEIIDGFGSYWYKIKTPDGQTGWCFGHYIKVPQWPYDADKQILIISFDGRFEDGTPEEMLAAIHDWLDSARDIELRNQFGLSVLMIAAWHNTHPESVSELLKVGAKVDDQDDYGKTPLMYAAESNPNSEIISALLKAGAKIDDRDKKGGTALMYAAQSNQNSGIISVLLKAGAKIDDKDKNGETALMCAAMYNKNPEVVSSLLKAGADKSLVSSEGKNAFQYAQNNQSLKGTKQFKDLENAQ
jgi:hypothetical protein